MSDVCGLLHSCGMIAIFGLPLHHHKIDSCDHLVLIMILTVIFLPSTDEWFQCFPCEFDLQLSLSQNRCKKSGIVLLMTSRWTLFSIKFFVMCEILFCHATIEIFGLPLHYQKINNYDLLVQMSDFCHVSSLHQQMPNIYKLPLSLLDALDWYLSTFLGTQGISVAFNSQIILWTCIPQHQMVFLEWVLGLD